MYYKVLRMVDGEFYSAVDNRYAIKYDLNKTVYPTITGSKLFVFKTIRDALHWACNADCFIFAVKCDNIQPLEEMVQICWNHPTMDIAKFWKNRDNLEECEENEDIDVPPDGTVGCDSLRLVKLVQAPPYSYLTLKLLKTLNDKMKTN